MDFVVSKVLMSICALLVVGVLSGIMTRPNLMDDVSDLKVILTEFCELVDRTVRTGAESVLEWTVPALSDGTKVKVTITSAAVKGEAGGHENAYQPAATLHLWTYSGQAMNATEVDRLDRAAQPIDLGTGETVKLLTVHVTYNNEPTLFAFVSR